MSIGTEEQCRNTRVVREMCNKRDRIQRMHSNQNMRKLTEKTFQPNMQDKIQHTGKMFN